MTLLRNNVDLGPALKVSSWRKVAIGTWRTAGDPSVYGMMEVPLESALAYIEEHSRASGERITVTHFAGKVCAETLKRHPEINCILRFGKLYPRKSVDVFFQVAADDTGEDLSGMTVRHADQKSLTEIAQEMGTRVRAIKSKTDKSFDRMKGLFGILPGFLSGCLLTITGFILYSLNLWTPLFGSPRDPFGSLMITNVGSLGLDTAFAPLVPYSRVPLLIALGAMREVAIVSEGQVKVGMVLKLCATFDHRLIDGVHASKMAKTIQKIFADPERELG